MVLNGDNLGPGFVKQPGGCAAHVAEALYDYPGAFDGNTGIARSFATHHIDTPAGCFDTAQAATQRDRLAGYYAGGGGAFVHGVGVHHPGHGLRVGVYIGRGYVFVGSDDYADLAGVAACDALEFPTGVVAGVDAYARSESTRLNSSH